MVDLTIQEKSGDKVRINPADAEKISADIGGLVTIEDINTGKKAVGVISVAQDVEEGKIEMDRTLFESIGLEEDFQVDVNVLKEQLVKVKSVEFGIDILPGAKIKGEDALVTVKSKEKEFLNFIGHRVFTINSQFKWDEQGLLITIKETNPKLQADNVARFGELENFTYSWAGATQKSFDGVLLIDISGSMKSTDMQVQDVGWAVERMGGELTGAYCQEFLSKFKEGKFVKRYEGAALCALVYLIEKIGRGVGDNIAVVPFSDNAEVVMFEGQPYYSSQLENISSSAESVVQQIESTWHGLTNLADGLGKAIDLSKNFDKKKIKMFVILTDGKADEEEKVLELVNSRLRPRMDVIIHTLGLGTDVNDQFLSSVSGMTGGQYDKVFGLKDLTKIYSKYALDLKIRGSDEALQDWASKRKDAAEPGKAEKRCSACGLTLSFIHKYKKWYCYSCQDYIDLEQ